MIACVRVCVCVYCRIHAKKGKTLDQLHKLIEGTPTGLASSFNCER